MNKIMMALRIEPGLKKFFQEFAAKEQRSLSNFLTHATIRYIKSQWNVDWEDVRLSYLENPKKESADKDS